MEKKFNALCIRATPYLENDKMLTLFTLEGGKVDCKIRGVKKPTAKLKFAGEVFCFAEYVLYEKDGRRTVKEVNEIDSFYGLRLDSDKFYAACAVVEFIREFVYGDTTQYDLFLLTVQILKCIEKSTLDPRISLIKFLMQALEIAGYGVNFSVCNVCGKIIEGRAFYDFETSVSLCESCATSAVTEIRIFTYQLLSELQSIDVEKLKNYDLSTYSPLFFDKTTAIRALKLLEKHLEIKAQVRLVSLKTLLT